jgi:hypothetical protein
VVEFSLGGSLGNVTQDGANFPFVINFTIDGAGREFNCFHDDDLKM